MKIYPSIAVVDLPMSLKGSDYGLAWGTPAELGHFYSALVFLLVVAGSEILWAVRTFVVVVAVVVDIVVVAGIVVVVAAAETFAAEGVVAVEAVVGGDFAASFVGEAVTCWRTLGSCPCSSVLATAASVGWAASVNWAR